MDIELNFPYQNIFYFSREKQGLLHMLEVLDGTKNVADKNKMVKEFSRSAAGRNSLKPEELRTVNALLLTVHYLLHEYVYKHNPNFFNK